MKLFKILFSLLFLLSASFSFASALDVCRGQTVTLTYSVSGVQSGQSCDAILRPDNSFDYVGQPPVSIF